MAEEVETEEVEVEVDAPEEEAEASEKDVKAESKEGKSSDEDDLDSYSKGVQERIRKLTTKYRQEERDRQEAVRMAEKLLEENKKLKSRVTELDKTSIENFGQRIQSLKSQWSAEYKRAYEAGDSDALLKAQEALNKLAGDEQRYSAAKARISRPQEQAQPAAAAQPAPAQQPQQAQAKPDPKAQQWAEKNKWFGEDPILTSAAFGVHAMLVEQEGFDPNSDEYYTELDRRLHAEFPHKFKKTKSGAGTAVAPAASSASRSTNKGRRTVRLSPSQIAIAKKLGVPLEEYAKYVKE
jgi:hypothetical protein